MARNWIREEIAAKGRMLLLLQQTTGMPRQRDSQDQDLCLLTARLSIVSGKKNDLDELQISPRSILERKKSIFAIGLKFSSFYSLYIFLIYARTSHCLIDSTESPFALLKSLYGHLSQYFLQ